MKYRSLAAAAIAVLLFNTLAFASGDNRRTRTKTRAARLVTMLPASDGVAVVDTKRLIDTALPTVLASNQTLLGNITGMIDEVRVRTGIDLRAFENIAIGATVKPGMTNDLDIDVVALATGAADMAAIVNAAKSAAGASYREEVLNGRTIIVFQPKASQKPAASGGIHDKIGHALRQEMALAVVDPRTVAVGSLARVRETVSGQSHIARDLSAHLPAKPAAINFAVRNSGLDALLPIDNDELGKKIGAIQVLAGSADIGATGLTISAVAKTATASEAMSLMDFLEVLRDMGGFVWGGSKNADKQMYARLLRSVKLSTRANNILLDVTVPQTDLDQLISKVK